MGQMEIAERRTDFELHGPDLPPVNKMGELHDRMPVILDEVDWPKWLGEEPANEEELLALLKPCREEWLKIWPVAKMVGNVTSGGARLETPVP